MNQQLLFQTIQQYVIDSGSIAQELQSAAQAELKDDDSYVTQVDTQLSNLAFQRFGALLPENRIISEERLDFFDEFAQSSDVFVVIDPIDGTRNFFHQIPLYGISVGVFKDKKPWMGVVGFPGLNEMFSYDGSVGTFAKGIWSSSDLDKKTINLEAHTLNRVQLNKNQTMLITNSYSRNHRWSYDVCTWMQTGCAAANACWPVLGRGIGTIMTDHVWDFAGGWPLLQAMGFELRGAFSGQLMDTFTLEWFDSKTLLLKEPVIASLPRFFGQLKIGVLS
jgi:fructose-1,6-bisphosphatase/inositol monophosphatase family enzyme